VGLSEWIQLGVGVVLFMSLFAVLWYAYETRRMRQEMERGRLSAIEPIVAIETRGSTSASVSIRLSNLGKGPAFNIQCAVKHPAFDMPGKSIRLHHLYTGLLHEQTIHADQGAPEFHGADIVAQYEDQYANIRYSWLKDGKLETGLKKD